MAALKNNDEWQPNLSRGLVRFQEQRKKKTSRKRTWGWIAAGAVAVSLPVMAFPSTRAFAQRCVSACVDQSNWARAFFIQGAAPGTTYVKPGDRRTAPDFVLNDSSGKPVRLSDFHGKVVLLNFWATWCAPCAAEIPWFVEFEKAHRNAGFATLGISLDEEGWDAVKPYIERHKVDYRVMVGDDGLAKLYGAEALPMTLIIDRSGRIAASHVGIAGKSEYESDIRAALAEQ